jgi:hypothetical protein
MRRQNMVNVMRLAMFGGLLFVGCVPLIASAQVAMTINSSQQRKAISPFIYGSNSSVITNRTFDRSGGNRLTGYNWETNASNAGSDWFHSSDYYLTNGVANLPPGEAVRPMLQAAASAGRASLVTVPTAGYVSADASGTVEVSQAAPSSRWKQVEAKKSMIYPGSPLSLSPNKTDGYVFTDEFVNWAQQTKQAGQQVFYSLDNEPGLWSETHSRLHPSHPTFTEMRDKTIAHAAAIKDVAPNTLVFGGVGYGWNEFTTLQDAPGAVTSPSHPGGDQSGEMHYHEYLLQQVRAAEVAQGRTLMDVLDLHWYPEAQGGGERIIWGNNPTSAAVVAARVQAPRSLWDPNYTETSWITQWGTWSGSPGNPGPLTLLPRVQRDINDFKPGTKIAITEYNYGAGDHISGGVAQADVLGVFGEQGVFAANWWDLGNGANFVNSAFNMYLNYDGAGSNFGDTSILATTNNDASSAVYASVDANDPTKMIVVLINRTGSAVSTNLSINHTLPLTLAEVYRLTSGSSNIAHLSDIVLSTPNLLSYNMPAFSVTTLELSALAGDFDGDRDVDGADFVVWQTNFPKTAGATWSKGDADGDGDVDGADFVVWQSHFSTAVGPGSIVIAEPASIALIGPLTGLCGAWLLRGRRSGN